ncbi:MAG: hypothetical protein WA632_01160 [Gallionella sp.]
MSESTLHHTQLNGVVEYSSALDQLCQLAQNELYLFEKNYDGLGFNSESRYDILKKFLLDSPTHRLLVLTHDTRYLSNQCPRMMTLLRRFGSSMSIFVTPKHLQRVTDPFSVADSAHFVRRFHFDDPRGMLGANDPEAARALKSRFMDMWASSRPGIAATMLGL